MIKGLYFKLNLENERDKRIYDFFQKYSGSGEKINMLSNLLSVWIGMQSMKKREDKNV